MAKVIGDGTRTRGRKKEALRSEAATLATTVKSGKGEVDVEVPLLPGEGRKKGESVTLSIPKGSVVIPWDLTREKNDANVRQQLRNAVHDAGASVSILSKAIMLDDGTESVVWMLAAKEGEA